MAASPGKPTVADPEKVKGSLEDQIAKLQSQVDAMNVERGVPSDPVAAAVQNLKTHLKTRKAMSPDFDFAELEARLEELTDAPDPDTAEMVEVIVQDTVARGAHLEIHYLTQLARDLRKAVLKERTSN